MWYSSVYVLLYWGLTIKGQLFDTCATRIQLDIKDCRAFYYFWACVEDMYTKLYHKLWIIPIKNGLAWKAAKILCNSHKLMYTGVILAEAWLIIVKQTISVKEIAKLNIYFSKILEQIGKLTATVKLSVLYRKKTHIYWRRWCKQKYTGSKMSINILHLNMNLSKRREVREVSLSKRNVSVTKYH